jgi:serine/threonine-protein kinase HipA
MATRRRASPSGSYEPVPAIEVHLWGRFVGAAALDPGLGVHAFAYDPEFVRAGIELAPLQMPIGAPGRVYAFPALPEATYHRLPAMLADALPDDFGNALIDRWMADRGVPRAAITPLDRLAYIAQRGMGALEFRPRRGPAANKPTAIELGELVGVARPARAGAWARDDDTAAALRTILEIGTSAGGARAKAVVAWNPTTGEMRSGQLDAPPGFEHWLLKFDGVGTDRELGSTQDYGRIEFAYHLMARQAGIAMSACRLLEEGGRAHFMTRRFDRDGTERHHVQTLCAMAHLDFRRKGTNSYTQLFLTMRQLRLPREDLVEAYRRMVFCVLARNCDDHTKNVAFRLRRGEGWRLAPAYDLTFAHNPVGEWTRQHLMSVHGKFGDFTRDDLLADADRFGIGEAPTIVAEVADAIAAWPRCAREAGVAATEIARIGALHLRL